MIEAKKKSNSENFALNLADALRIPFSFGIAEQTSL